MASVAAACGPHAHIPQRPVAVAGALESADSDAMLAHTLAPLLYVQRDESFPLSRVVAVVHPRRPIIAYHLLWRDDVSGAWLPFTKATDEEVVWVGYDRATKAPTDVWTYWHGSILHRAWTTVPVEINVQWGKHGSLPRGMPESELPFLRKLNGFFAFTYVGLPDALLGRINRKGEVCFCHGYARYRDFSRQMPLADRLDAVVRTADPYEALASVFGRPFSNKLQWPKTRQPVSGPVVGPSIDPKHEPQRTPPGAR